LKILFLLGSASPGRDGVGDYTRILSAALIECGHTVSMVATHDKDIYESSRELQGEKNNKIECLRIPKRLPMGKRMLKIEKEIFEKCPDWISLQFVPYSFHPKGLPFRFLELLSILLSSHRTQVMFHECWIGITRVSPIDHKLAGYLQRKMVVRFIRRLNPDIVTTSNELYRSVLGRADIIADILPLFSNIGIVAEALVSKKEEVDNLMKSAKSYLNVGVFGTIYPQVDLVSDVEKLGQRINNKRGKIRLIAFGRSGENGKARLDDFEKVMQGRVPVVRLGELKSEDVSRVMNLLDISISCTPRPHLGKSGVFAAMRLHGVEVISTTNEELPEYDELIKEAIPRLYDRPAEHWSVDWVSRKFVDLLVKVPSQAN